MGALVRRGRGRACVEHALGMRASDPALDTRVLGMRAFVRWHARGATRSAHGYGAAHVSTADARQHFIAVPNFYGKETVRAYN